MRKAVIFDDEYIVLQGLQAMIDWKKHGIEIAGTAGDGAAALAVVREKRPDIILTDIRMPGMDGLELIERVMQEAPDTYTIVFSGFNEFEYVKRAISLGVADYLEKPITIQTIEQAVAKMTGRLAKREEQRQELLEKATWELLLSGGTAEASWREKFGPRAERVVGATVLAAAADFALPDDPLRAAVPLRSGEERLCAVFHYEPPTHEFWGHVENAAEQAAAPIGAGGTHASPAAAAASYREAQRALRAARFLEHRGLMRFEELGALMTAPQGLPEREEAIVLGLRSGNREAFYAQVERFVEWLRAEKLDPHVMEREMLRCVYMMQRAASEDGHEPAGESDLAHVEIRETANKDELISWFRKQVDRVAEGAFRHREHTKEAVVERARRYMEQHCGKDVSLQEVADHVGMNSSYLSVLFKEVMGESYIKYLTRYRMELAKTMLRQGLKVNEVSERVGYHTYRHFSEVFKKFAGCSPGQYRDLKNTDT
ncbi:response regulator [Paenibacillus sp.]|uniref:response regulator n=1 Tax=Paenibacillus sp. TaxID=58172 RepID=UPI002D38DED7|nr:response regulator [Paenibacillus sp.]HZG86579.1 response regulator [Paenibacillus sp.]